MKELLKKSKETKEAVASLTSFLKKEFAPEVMSSSSIISQMYHAAEDFYWELAGIESDLDASSGRKRYFVDGLQISKEQALLIKADNETHLEKARTTGDVTHLEKCKFIVEL